MILSFRGKPRQGRRARNLTNQIPIHIYPVDNFHFLYADFIFNIL